MLGQNSDTQVRTVTGCPASKVQFLRWHGHREVRGARDGIGLADILSLTEASEGSTGLAYVAVYVDGLAFRETDNLNGKLGTAVIFLTSTLVTSELTMGESFREGTCSAGYRSESRAPNIFPLRWRR